MSQTQELMKTWTAKGNALLAGRTIKEVKYQDNNEEYDWHQSAPIIVLDDGTEIIASRDPEGNGPGALFIESPQESTLLGPL